MQQESCLLRDAIRTMMLQICKVGVTYSTDLVVEGTVAVTVDHSKVIVIHFDDCISQSLSADVNSVAFPADSSTVSEGFRSAISELSTSFRQFASPGQLQSLGCRPGWFAGSTSSKMMNCLRNDPDETLNERVAIDVGSEDETG